MGASDVITDLVGVLAGLGWYLGAAVLWFCGAVFMWAGVSKLANSGSTELSLMQIGISGAVAKPLALAEIVFASLIAFSVFTERFWPLLRSLK